MTVKVYASGVLAYDSQLPEENHYSMISVRIQEEINKGGTAKLILPPMHRRYDGFPAMRTLVEIYRNDKLRWRGRALPHSDDIYGCRTVSCEGELCFLNDATMRPYMLSGSPAELFTQLLTVYNNAVAGDPWKQFEIGEITIMSDVPIELSATNPEQVYTSLQKLRNKCGGYIFFDSTEAGLRRINWYSELPYRCSQPVRFGRNLLDYSSSASITGIATRIIPYGAKDGNGNRLQINVDGKDYVENPEAQAQRGIIEKPVIYDGITDAATLQAVAEADVMTAGTIPETIRLSALDLSRFDASIDSFAVGQFVRAHSDYHTLSGEYALVAMDEDLVKPGIGSVTLTQDVRYYDGSGSTLSGSISNEMTQQEAQRIAATLDVVKQATAWLTNGKGYKVERVDANGNTIDTLYMDTPDINTAVNVLRIGQSGIGFSHNGVDGPYVSAWTIDGQFNTDLISTSVITSADGTIKIDLGKNIFSINTIYEVLDLLLKGKIEATKNGLTLYGWDLDNEDYADTLHISAGHLGERAGGGSNIWAPGTHLNITAGTGDGTGYRLQLGLPNNAIVINGKTSSWKSNGDGTYTLIGQ